MSATAEVEAQAKINLRLRVLAREASGYHQLETLFLRIALADTVRVRRTESRRTLDVSGVAAGSSLGPVEQNLAWRAADAYLRASGGGGGGGFAIELEKRIPVGGGLGGGSADAGAVLRALDAISPAPLGEPALLRLAAGLGADVPFLTSEAPCALGWGRGERLLALSPPSPRQLLLVVPPFGVNTAEAFGWLAMSREGESPRAGESMVLGVESLTRWDMLASIAGNDFQDVVSARYPVMSDVVDGLQALGCEISMMSGSGSVVFGVLRAGVSWDPDDGGALPAGADWQLIATSTAERVEPVRLLD